MRKRGNMQVDIQKIEPYLPRMLKYLNFFVVLLWKLGLGKLMNIWPSVTGRILVIRHFGRDSRTSYLTPLNYAEKEGAIYVVSKFGSQSDWYFNIMANPQVEVWLPDGWYMAQMEPVDDPTYRLALIREVLTSSGLAAPLLGIYPRTMSDVELEAATESYRLVKISKQAAHTGAEGPGSLAWIWPFVLAALWLKKKKR